MMKCLTQHKKHIQVTACDTTADYRSLTEWMPTTGMNNVDFLLDARNLTNKMQIKPAYQYAAVRTERPDGFAMISEGDLVSANGTEHFNHVLTNANDRFWVRFGLCFKLSSGTAQGRVEVDAHLTTRSEGGIIGAKTVVLNPISNVTTHVSYFPITDWQPSLDLSHVKAAFILQQKTEPLAYRLVIRSANDQAAPGHWVRLEANYTKPPTGNSERVVADIDVSGVTPRPQNEQWYQLGVATQHGAEGSGILQAITAARLA